MYYDLLLDYIKVHVLYTCSCMVNIIKQLDCYKKSMIITFRVEHTSGFAIWRMCL